MFVKPRGVAMVAWIAAALIGPVVLIGLVWPGWGDLAAQGPVPSTVVEALAGPSADASPTATAPTPTAEAPTAQPTPVGPQSPGTVMFNDPTGTADEQYALVRHVNAAIDAAPAGSVVRLAAYSFALPPVADRLVAAHRRGAAVQLIVDDHAGSWRGVDRVRREVGDDVGRASFVKVCRLSCRGRSGNQHAKFLVVSGSANADVVVTGSLNLTRFSSQRQWNDLVTVHGDGALNRQFVSLFQRMAQDRPQRTLTPPPAGGGLQLEVSPSAGESPAPDPLVTRLAAIRCDGATDGAGVNGRTLVRISMHAWNGDRGVTLARQVAGLARQGCDVKVLYGIGTGRRVTSILTHAGVPAVDSRRSGRSTHQKLMILSGHFGDDTQAGYVWTGSHNWSDRSLRNDEVTLRVAGSELVGAYLANFEGIWNRATRR